MFIHLQQLNKLNRQGSVHVLVFHGGFQKTVASNLDSSKHKTIYFNAMVPL